jgi:UDP-N-acetylglucosamine transferase subunit ALG13
VNPPPQEPPLVLVAVGTDFHPFDRVVSWVDDWLDRPGTRARCLVQYGHSRAPRNAEGKAFLGHAELQTAMSEAAVVIAHGGPGTLMEARSHGHQPICVPRDPVQGEHVDEHQQRFARHLASAGLVTLAETHAELVAALESALDAARNRRARRTPLGQQAPPDHVLPASIARVAQLLTNLTAPAAKRSGRTP